MAQEIPSRLSSNPFSYQNFAERSMSKRVTSLPQKDVILNTRTESLEIKDNEIRKNVQNETANQQLIEQQEVQQDTNRNPTNLSFLFENGKLTKDAFNAIEEGGLEGLVSLTNEIAGSKLNLKSDADIKDIKKNAIEEFQNEEEETLNTFINEPVIEEPIIREKIQPSSTETPSYSNDIGTQFNPFGATTPEGSSFGDTTLSNNPANPNDEEDQDQDQGQDDEDDGGGYYGF